MLYFAVRWTTHHSVGVITGQNCKIDGRCVVRDTNRIRFGTIFTKVGRKITSKCETYVLQHKASLRIVKANNGGIGAKVKTHTSLVTWPSEPFPQNAPGEKILE